MNTLSNNEPGGVPEREPPLWVLRQEHEKVVLVCRVYQPRLCRVKLHGLELLADELILDALEVSPVVDCSLVPGLDRQFQELAEWRRSSALLDVHLVPAVDEDAVVGEFWNRLCFLERCPWSELSDTLADALCHPLHLIKNPFLLTSELLNLRFVSHDAPKRKGPGGALLNYLLAGYFFLASLILLMTSPSNTISSSVKLSLLAVLHSVQHGTQLISS